MRNGNSKNNDSGDEAFSPWHSLISDKVSGRTSKADDEQLERYLAEEPASRAEQESIEKTVGLLRNLPQVTAPRSFVLTRQQARSYQNQTRWYGAARWSMQAAALLLVCLLALEFFGTFNAAQPATVAINTTTISPALPGVGTLSPAETKDGSGSISGAGGVIITPGVQGIPAISATTSSNELRIEPVRALQLGLLTLLVGLGLLTFALRPRIKNRLR